MAHIGIVVPVYKAQDCLEELYARLCAALSPLTEDFEIYLIEDCGGDRSWDVIVRLAQRDPRVRGIQFSRNFGQHFGITAGLDLCDADWVVVMDCDLQDRPEEIPHLYRKAQEGHDVVLARRGRRQDPSLKRFGSWAFFRVFNWLSDMKYDHEAGNFRIVSRRVVETFRRFPERLRFFGGLVAWMGFPTAAVDVQHDPRFAGDSSYTFRKLWKLATEVIIAHSDKPLRMAARGGFVVAGGAMLYGMYLVWRSLVYGVAIQGWASLMVSIYFIGGAVIALLGIVGVYVGKAYDEMKGRPLYIIRRTTD